MNGPETSLRWRKFATGLLVSVATCGSPVAHADSRAEARKHFDDALVLLDRGEVPRALAEFRHSYEVLPHYSVLYNIGLAYVALSKPVEAVEYLRQYLRDGGSAVPPKRQAEVEQEIAAQEKQIGRLSVVTRPAGALVQLDARNAGRTPLAGPLRTGKGDHSIVVELAGYEPANRTVSLQGGEERTVEIGLTPTQRHDSSEPRLEPAAALAAEATDPDGNSPWRRTSWLRLGGGIAAGAGGIATIVGTVFWARSRASDDEANAQWLRGQDDAARGSKADAQDMAKMGNIVFVSGLFLIAGGVTAFLLAPSARPREHQSRITVAPAIAPHAMGIATGGTW